MSAFVAFVGTFSATGEASHNFGPIESIYGPATEAGFYYAAPRTFTAYLNSNVDIVIGPNGDFTVDPPPLFPIPAGVPFTVTYTTPGAGVPTGIGIAAADWQDPDADATVTINVLLFVE